MKELSFTTCILETGKRYLKPFLYKKNGYHITTNYGQYIDEDSVCFSKSIFNKKKAITLMEPLLI
jgi:hypothetical protein